MTRYAAFLRAVNVGGKNPVPMAALSERIAALGFGEVRTFLQSGNVVFSAPPRTATAAVERKLAAMLEAWLGFEVTVMVRSLAALEAQVARAPFEGQRVDAETKLYVAFLAAEPAEALALPCVVAKEGLEVFAREGADLFILSRRVGTRYGFPNAWVEKELGVPATSRNWNTVEKIVAACRG